MITAMVRIVNISIAFMRSLSYFRCIKNMSIRLALTDAIIIEVSAPCFPNFRFETATVAAVRIKRQVHTIKYVL